MKNLVSTIVQCLAIFAVISLVWALAMKMRDWTSHNTARKHTTNTGRVRLTKRTRTEVVSRLTQNCTIKQGQQYVTSVND